MRVLVLLLLIVCGNYLFSQSVTVVDATTGKGIAQVTVSGASNSESTDAQGIVDLGAFSKADTLLFQHLSYHPRFLEYAEVLAAEVIELQGKAYSIDPVVISANKWEQYEERVADQITFVTPKDISFNNSATSADVLSSTGEVYVQKSQLGGGSPMIRGFSANRVLIVVDGVRMNNAIYRSGNLQNVINIDPNAIRVAEVIHGPGAMTYGSDAIGGVMDFHTYDPEFRNDTNTLISGGAMARFASATEEESFNTRINASWEKVALMGSYSFTSFGNPVMGSNGPDEYLRNWYVSTVNGVDTVLQNSDPKKQLGNAYDMEHFIGKLRLKPHTEWDVLVSAYHSATSDIPRYDRLIQTSDGEPRFALWEYGPQKWTMFSARIEHRRDSGLWNNARLTVAHQTYDESRFDTGFKDSDRRERFESVRGLWANVDFEKDLAEESQLFYGLESVSNRVSSGADLLNRFVGVLPINPRYPDQSTWSTYSAYASITHPFGKNFTFNGGLRYNHTMLQAEFDTTLFPYPETSTELNEGAITGSAGIIWQLDSTRRVSFDVSRGFRAPNIDDIGKVFDSEPGTVILPNPDLGPEYVNSFEIGYQRKFKEDYRMDFNAYYSILDDAIVRRPSTVNGLDSIQYDGELSQVLSLQNAANANVYGFHIGLMWKFHENWTGEAHYNWQDGEEDNDDLSAVPSRHVPPAFGLFAITWQNSEWRVKVYTEVSDGFDADELAPSELNKPHIYAVDGNGNPYSPSWYTVNLKGEYQITDTISLAAGVENITDQRYRTYSSGLVAPGRNFLASVRANF